MNLTEQDIQSNPAILRQTLDRVRDYASDGGFALRGPAAFIGCGTSYCVALTAARLYEEQRGLPARGIMGSEYLPHPGWSHVAISRTGHTTELVEAMRRAQDAGLQVLLLEGEADSLARRHASLVLPLEFAPERAIIQTRFVSATVLAARLLIGGGAAYAALKDLPEQVGEALSASDPAPLARFRHFVFLGRGWRYGLALAASMNMQETAQIVPEAHQTLEYRHGPIACADEETLVWCFDAPGDEQSAAVLQDIRRTGATVHAPGRDPLLSLVEVQLLAVRVAEARGVDPDAPRHLTRAIML